MDKGSYVFISYSSMDSLIVAQVTRLLTDCNIAYWKAPEMIPAGSNYAREIPKAIRECEAFVLILSKASQHSIWVEKEVDVAICCRKRVIPIKIDNEPLNELYHFYLNNVQTINVNPTQSKSLLKRDAESLKENFYGLIPGGMDTSGSKDAIVEVPMREAAGTLITYEDCNVEADEHRSPMVDSAGSLEADGSRRIAADVHRNPVVGSTDNHGSDNSCNTARDNYSIPATDIRSNALRMNKIPICCESCNSVLEQRKMGVYICVRCGREHYDDYRKVRNYLERVGAAPALVIARDTGVSRKTIEYFRENGFIESR